MASILDKYGIKEVADVTFYQLDSNGKPDYPVLYLDTLKVSTIEQTAEQTEARGGKGNPPLIIWDYGKEITVTLEDALFSAKSMAIMFGNGRTKGIATSSITSGQSTVSKRLIMRTEQFTAESDGTLSANHWKESYEDNNGYLHTKINPKVYTEDGAFLGDSSATLSANTKYFVTYDLEATQESAVIEISASTFPGTYYVTGDTYARSEASGQDEFFQFIIPKAKMQAENTITLEAEGDPSVFNMSLRVMRPADGIMMKLVKYDLVGDDKAGEGATSTIAHNHGLNETKASKEDEEDGE